MTANNDTELWALSFVTKTLLSITEILSKCPDVYIAPLQQ